MNDDNHDLHDKIALFRYGVLGDLVHAEPGAPGLYEKLRERSARTYEIPGTRRTRVAAETIRGWLTDYRRGGYDALKPKPRADNGMCRSIPQPFADMLCILKDEKPHLSVEKIIEEVASHPDFPADLHMPRSTVHRLLSRNGLMTKRPEETGSKDRRRFSFEKAGALWMSDVMHGPAVPVDGKKKRKTYLIALLDDATRVVPYAAFAMSENTSAFLTVFKQATTRRGIPERLYVDNGAAYRSQQLSMVCAKMGITLVHARPYQPAGKGKIERWFRTVRLHLLAGLQPKDKTSLDALNRALWAYVEGEYHRRPHKGLDGDTPADRWAQRSGDVRMPRHDLDFDDLFLFEEKRKVTRDRVVSLRGVPYEVDAVLVGQTVTLRFDPSKPKASIKVYAEGKFVQTATPVDAYANCFVKRDHTTKLLGSDDKPKFPEGLSMRHLRNRKDENNV